MLLDTIIFIITGYFINFIFTITIHGIAAETKIVKFSKEDIVNVSKKIREILCTVVKVVMHVICMDFFIAKLFKNFIGDDKDKKKSFIIKSNFYNLVFSGMALLIAFIIPEKVIENTIFKYIVISFFTIRAVSRSFEILVAFTMDIVYKKEKSSSLSSSDRIVLGIKSFFEIIVNYTIVYYFMNFISDIFINSLTINDILKSLMKSIGVSTLTNVGDLTVISAIQLFSSMSLIYFGLAGYISDNDKV